MRKSYGMHDLELVAILRAFKMGRYYLIGRKFQLIIDNVSLKYFSDQPNMNSKQAKWLTFISEYNFEILHFKGKENKILDALSKKHNHIFSRTTISWLTDIPKRKKSKHLQVQI